MWKVVIFALLFVNGHSVKNEEYNGHLGNEKSISGSIVDVINGLNTTFKILRRQRFKEFMNQPKDQDIQQSLPSSNTVSCQKIVAYYVGKFQYSWSTDPNSGFNAQFQISISANKQEKKIQLEIEQLNRTYSGNQDIYFALNDIQNAYFCETRGSKCDIPFSEYLTDLRVSVDNNFDIYDIMYFPNFLNDFSLDSAIGKCTNSQSLGARWPPNPSLIDYCVCCDDYSSESQCPTDPWISPVPTQRVKTTTAKPTPTQSLQTTTANPLPHKTQTIVGYYTGRFKRTDRSDYIDAQFMVKLVADTTTQLIYLTVTNMNQTYPIDDIYFNFYNYGYYQRCYSPYINCPIPFTTIGGLYFRLDMDTKDTNYVNIMEFDNFNNTFVFDNPTNGCTNNQIDTNADTSLFSYCICYDEYKEGGEFNCPSLPKQ